MEKRERRKEAPVIDTGRGRRQRRRGPVLVGALHCVMLNRTPWSGIVTTLPHRR